MGISSGHLRRQCSGLWKRGLAFKATPPSGGKERWFISRDYDARLRDSSEGRRHQVPDLCHYSEHQRQEMWKRVEAVKHFREMRSRAKSKESDWLPTLIETLKADPACPDKISRDTLHRWSEVTGDIDTLARKINGLIEQLIKRDESRMPTGFIRTLAAENMLALIQKTSQWVCMSLILADSGRGKTTVLEAALELVPGSVMIRATEKVRRVALLRSIARAYGVRPGPQAHIPYERIMDVTKGAGRLLMVDEAHRLDRSDLEVLRDLHDEAGMGIILAGTRDLAQTCFGEAEMGQLSSRIALRLDLVELMAQGGDGGPPLHSVDEIMKMFYSQQARLSTDAAETLRRIAQVPGLGGLRLCRQLCTVARTAVEAQGLDVVDAKLIRSALVSLQDKAAVGRVESAAKSQEKIRLVVG